MVKCKYCEKEMKTAAGCIKYMFKYEDGTVMEPLKVVADEVGGPQKRCHDCAAIVGNYHHVECDMERDPRDNSQALSSDATRVKNAKVTKTPKKYPRDTMPRGGALSFNWYNWVKK
jgi:hypothetical protein